MYVEAALRDLEQLKTEYSEQLMEILRQSKSSLYKAGKLYGYKWVPDEVYIEDEEWHPGHNLVEVYGFDVEYPDDPAKALTETCKAIKADIMANRLNRMNYFDYLIIPSFTFNNKTVFNAIFDLVGFNIFTGNGPNNETIAEKGVTFQLHSPNMVLDTWNNIANTALRNACGNTIEQSLGVPLRTIYFHNGEALNNAWVTSKITFPDEREISHPVMVGSVVNASSFNPRAIYTYAPQYRYKNCHYWLNNPSTNAAYASSVDTNGIIQPIDRTRILGCPIEFTI